jgi:hypothetical protein
MRQEREHKRDLQGQRVVKLLLPVSLIRELDRLLVEGIGGFTTRNEFVREAVEAYLLELTYEAAPDEPVAARRGDGPRLRAIAGERRGREASVPPLERATTPAVELGSTALPLVAAEGVTVSGVAQVADDPLFGLHNRDYPSLWAAARLDVYLDERGWISLDEFLDRVTDEAWSHGALLRRLEQEAGGKLTALFPTNREKVGAASNGFRMFGIGTATRANGRLRAEGPLFAWRVIDVELHQDAPVVGLTREGRELLAKLGGLTVEQPHSREHALAFLRHVKQHARGDYWGFEQVLRIVGNEPRRLELVAEFQKARPDWRESVAATNAQGYVARGREWGLIAPKVIEGRYRLTEFGVGVVKGGIGG